MYRALIFGCVLCSAAPVMAQSNPSAVSQHGEESAENAWIERMPVPTPPPLHTVSAPPPARQESTRTVRISGGVMAGLVLTKVNPVYPPDALANHMEGSVVLSAKVGTDGTVQDLQAISGPEVLRQAALDAVRQWTYKPYLLNGNPVTVMTTITVNFRESANPAQ